MELYDDKIMKIIKDERNNWPIQVLTANENNIVAFYSDIAIPTHYIECEIEGKQYYGQRILILKEKE
jgi:hypothetical protein